MKNEARQIQTGAPGSPGALAFFSGMVYIYLRGEKMKIELNKNECSIILSGLYDREEKVEKVKRKEPKRRAELQKAIEEIKGLQEVFKTAVYG